MYLTVMCWCKDDGVSRPMTPVDDGYGNFKCKHCGIVVSAKLFNDETVFEYEKYNNKVVKLKKLEAI